MSKRKRRYLGSDLASSVRSILTGFYCSEQRAEKATLKAVASSEMLISLGITKRI
ncbi:hypothetical protein [Piscirickettsia salmonis]|uniref:Uncharacterized protein n=1 Tax=Piscirickettsia salmonis TaxID=1238 RepID=A0A9Q6LMM3_PISSA|nr:hypothetical protein [Piscirickettsia salmonis]QGO07607.1 hypothetical protein Psal009_03566 [Piscirickettsia salmonis]QHS34178.1 hypothetical protein GW535_16715 [Piscirickettsia salmonis]QIX57520.1 hypothetical protein GW536_19410 [Piscirickettsia salmonis]QNR82640.1 hypothetical protein ICC15_19635 [Piscirickettsia salmonis]